MGAQTNWRPRAALAAFPRVHLLAHANPIAKDITRFGLADVGDFVAFIRAHLPTGSRLTHSERVFAATESPTAGGRDDDDARVRDLQGAIDDPTTGAIVALAGGAWLGRILPHLKLDGLARRRTPLLVTGFSEITGFVNWMATYRCVRALYWLCPNYIAWKVAPFEAAREAFATFWRELTPAGVASRLSDEPVRATLVSGRVVAGRTRVIGGCLSVLAATLAGPIARRVRPDGAWLAIEDVNEATYRVDRYLATLKLAGWFERLAGVLVGDFHSKDERDQTAAVIELLRYHLPKRGKVPIATTRDVGHVWPIRPLQIGRLVALERAGRGELLIRGSLR